MTDLMKAFQTTLAEIAGISDDFVAASNHDYNCTCPICREWWLSMGPDPDTVSFGPFGDELWEDYAARLGVSIDDAKRMAEHEAPGGDE